MSAEIVNDATMEFKEKYRNFYNLITNEPLIESIPTLGMCSLEALQDGGSESGIYYGTGLTTPKEIAIGLPFDVLGMILVAERMRRSLGYGHIYHHIADTHAKTNLWISREEVDQRASVVRTTLEKVAINLELPNLHIILSSEFDGTDEYLNLVREFKTSSNLHEYVIREMADMEWYRRKYNVKIKTGWIIQATEADIGYDERMFDREYIRIKGKLLSFVYTKPGRTLDKSRPKASPYIQVAGEHRLLLDRNEKVAEKFKQAAEANNDPNLGGAKRHLENIVRCFEKLYGSLGKYTLEEKLQQIIDRATK